MGIIKTNNITKPLFYCMVIIFFIQYLGSCSFAETKYPTAINGALDLSNWDFEKSGPVPLKGEWKFIWMNEEDDYTSQNYDDSNWDTLSIPGRWYKKAGEYFGYCWLRLKVTTNKNADLGLFIWETETSYSLYVNGKKILENGQAGNTEDTTIPGQLPDVNVIPEEDTILIAWKVSNFHASYEGGPTFAPKLGLFKDLKAELWHKDFINIIMQGIIMMMGFYHFFLWINRKKDKSSIIFTLICLVVLLYSFGNNKSLNRIFVYTNVQDITFRIQHITPALAWLVFVTFFSYIFPDEFNRLILRIFQISGVLAALFTLFTPVKVFTAGKLYIQIIMFLACIWILYSNILAITRKRKDAWFFLFGFLIIVASAVNDVLNSHFVLPTGYVTPLGLVIFTFFLTANFFIRYARVLKTSERLSKNLQEEVNEQTKIIKDKNEKLQRLNQERTNYFVNLAHETKTPLTLIVNYLNKYIKEKGIDKNLSVIKENFIKLKNNMVNFLDYEKLVRGQPFYNHNQTINLSRALKSSLSLFKEYADKKNISLYAGKIKDNILISADPHAVNRIINNLLDNAVKYTESGGSIEAGLVQKMDKAELFVKDTGKGIPEDHLPNIFKSYYQISQEKTNTQGIGMGLNIIKKIVDDLGGKIIIESEKDKGSYFRIILKRYHGKTPETEAEITFEDQYSIHNTTDYKIIETDEKPDKYTILVVEDNLDMLEYLHQTLSEYYNVFTATNGKDALEKLKKMKKLNLIISDIMMDVMDGYTFLNKLKKMELYNKVPLIFLTAKNTQKDKINALINGAVDFISKPFDIDELRAKTYSIIHITESQFERSKFDIIQKLINSNINEIKKDDFSMSFEKKCFKYDLSSREKEILLLLIQGKQYSEISKDLSISLNTVKSHIKNIYSKCDINSKTQLKSLFILH